MWARALFFLHGRTRACKLARRASMCRLAFLPTRPPIPATNPARAKLTKTCPHPPLCRPCAASTRHRVLSCHLGGLDHAPPRALGRGTMRRTAPYCNGPAARPLRRNAATHRRWRDVAEAGQGQVRGRVGRPPRQRRLHGAAHGRQRAPWRRRRLQPRRVCAVLRHTLTLRWVQRQCCSETCTPPQACARVRERTSARRGTVCE